MSYSHVCSQTCAQSEVKSVSLTFTYWHSSLSPWLRGLFPVLRDGGPYLQPPRPLDAGMGPVMATSVSLDIATGRKKQSD